MDIMIDEDGCCGAGQCGLTAPQVFDRRDEDGVVVLPALPPEVHALRHTAAVRPAAAIRVSG